MNILSVRLPEIKVNNNFTTGNLCYFLFYSINNKKEGICLIKVREDQKHERQ